MHERCNYVGYQRVRTTFLTTRAEQPVQFQTGTRHKSSPQRLGRLWSSSRLIPNWYVGSYPAVEQSKRKTDHPPSLSAKLSNA
jgi:hypothetical protein